MHDSAGECDAYQRRYEDLLSTEKYFMPGDYVCVADIEKYEFLWENGEQTDDSPHVITITIVLILLIVHCMF